MLNGLDVGKFTIPSVQTASYPARPGNALRPLVDGEPAFRRVCEAIEAARESVWATVTFMWPDFQMPGGRGSALDVLNRAAARGLDVRLIFWRPDPETEKFKANAFWVRRSMLTCSARALLPYRSDGIALSLDSVSIKRPGSLIQARRQRPSSLAGSI
jgi:phosphatidylserine/phosphatidylglycerophosphate/cardiolipin synthase-like enzyme